MPMNYAIVLAVGKEANMKFNLPKCAIPLLGKPMISYVLDEIKETSIEKIICILNHPEELYNDALQNVEVVQSFSCIQEIKDAGFTIVLSGDMPLVRKDLLQGVIDAHIKNKNDITIGAIPGLDDGNTNLIKEEQSRIYCINNQLLPTVLVPIKGGNIQKEYGLFDHISSLSKTYKINVYFIHDKLPSICNLIDISEVENELRKSINKKHMLNGVFMENWESITIGPDVKIEPNCWIRSGSIILGTSEIQSGAVIGPNSEINNSKIMENAVVMQSLVNDSVVGKEAKIGPFTHLRMNTVIGDYDRIGNFVEIKNSVIGRKTNVSHLTYVGDTDCGSGVNFGCGVVTVNYDGKNKFRTTIGDNVFIGCNSNLIAPVKIENGGFIAAGSTITENLEQDDFAIARAKQVIKKGYAKKFGYKKV